MAKRSDRKCAGLNNKKCENKVCKDGAFWSEFCKDCKAKVEKQNHTHRTLNNIRLGYGLNAD